MVICIVCLLCDIGVVFFDFWGIVWVLCSVVWVYCWIVWLRWFGIGICLLLCIILSGCCCNLVCSWLLICVRMRCVFILMNFSVSVCVCLVVCLVVCGWLVRLLILLSRCVWWVWCFGLVVFMFWLLKISRCCWCGILIWKICLVVLFGSCGSGCWK